MADINMPIYSEHMMAGPLEPNRIQVPRLWRSIGPGGLRTPPYLLGWRLTRNQLQACLDPERMRTTVVADFEKRCISPRWTELGYAKKYTAAAQPDVALVPGRDCAWDHDVIVYVFSNSSKERLEAAQGPQAQEIIAAAVHTLNLPNDLASDLKWHTRLPRSKSSKN